MNSTSAKAPFLLIPETSTSSRCATWIAIGPLSGSAPEISGRIVSTPRGVSATSQQGGGSIPSRHLCSVPIIQLRLCNTRNSGELKSLLETRPVLIQYICGALNVSEAEIKSAASRRVRKSRGEQPRPRQNKTASSNDFALRMNVDYCRERILTNCDRLRGTKGADAICPSNLFDQRPGSGARHAGQLPSSVSLYCSIKYPKRSINNSPHPWQ